MPDIALRFNKDVIVVEGGMDAMLARMGIADEPCLPYLNVLAPDTIADIHRSYHLAGAQAVITNTFGATEAQLGACGLEDRMEELNHAGMALARSSTPEHVLACVGPCGIEVLASDESGQTPTASYRAAYRQYADQICVLASDDPDAILLDTFESLSDLICALDAAHQNCDMPVFASCAFTPEGKLAKSGEALATVALAVEASGADVFGINCIVSPSQMLPLLTCARRETVLPLLVRPDVKAIRSGRNALADYSGSPAEMEEVAPRFREAGAQFIGSCCGSTPAITGAIYATVSGLDVVRRR